MELRGKKITVHDMTLRDGMHPKRHLMTLEQMRTIAVGLDEAGVPQLRPLRARGTRRRSGLQRASHAAPPRRSAPPPGA